MLEASCPTVGVDVGGTKILIGLVSGKGEVLFSRKYPMRRENQAQAEEAIFSAAGDFAAVLKEHPELPAPAALGMGAVGHMDPEAGVWLHSYNIPVQTPIPAAERMSRLFGLPAWLDNDVHCAALGEGLYGHGRKAQCMLYLNVGTGLSAGILQGGMLLRGADNYAGEIGYMDMNCDEGGQKLEPAASGGGLIQGALELLPEYPGSLLETAWKEGNLHSTAVFEAAGQGDPLARRLAERAVRYLGAAVCNLMAVVNPDAVVFGGGAIRSPGMLEQVSAYTAAHCVGETYKSLRYIGLSALNPAETGMIGAAALAGFGLSGSMRARP